MTPLRGRPDDPEAFLLARSWMQEARRVVVLTGAGISTDSGIPDFRGPNGVWTKNPAAERAAHIDQYVADRAIRRAAWQQRLTHPAWDAQPSAGHRALALFERRGTLTALVTQNVDGLHQQAGSSTDLVIEVHGTLREVACLSCAERAPMQRALERVRAGEQDPPCRSCGGLLKSATVSFGQPLVAHDLERAERAARTCDVLLAVGTTLTVYPVADLPRVAMASGARLITLNAEATAYDDVADAVLRGPIGELLGPLVGAESDPRPDC